MPERKTPVRPVRVRSMRRGNDGKDGSGPHAVARLFLCKHAPHLDGTSSRQELADVFKVYWEGGYKAAQRGDPNPMEQEVHNGGDDVSDSG